MVSLVLSSKHITPQGPGKRGHIVATHCCPWCFLSCANWETFVADTKCFWTKSETFFVSRTQNLCPQQILHARANGETFVPATMCPRLPGPLVNVTQFKRVVNPREVSILFLLRVWRHSQPNWRWEKGTSNGTCHTVSFDWYPGFKFLNNKNTKWDGNQSDQHSL